MKVQLENLTKRYGNTVAVRDLNLDINDGALHFFLGPSGCGKTTTLRMLAGLEKPTSGRILFAGRDVTTVPAAERNIGMVFQNYALWPHMTVRKNIEYGLRLRKLSKSEIAQRLDEVLSITQLGPYIDRYPGQLSGGQQQRVALARALAIRPSVLLLDEPLSNLDAKLRLEMRDNILRIHRQTRLTTVYVTHDQKEALSMGTDVSVMNAGNMIQTDTPRRLYQHPATPFIASFIGETNLLAGTFTSVNGMPAAKTAAGTFVAAEARGFREGDPVSVSIRPEAMQVLMDGAKGGDDVKQAHLEHMTYLGESEQFFMRVGEALHLRAALFHVPEHRLQDGESIAFRVDPKDVLLLKPESEVLTRT